MDDDKAYLLLHLGKEDFRKWCEDPINKQDLQDIELRLSCIAQGAAERATYIGMRHGHGCGDQGHEDADDEAKKVLKGVRKAMGYSYP